MQQEGLDAFGLLFQDFLDQIVQHKTVAAGERFDEAGGVFTPLHRECPLQGKGGQLQAGDPAFGAGFQRGNVFCRKVQAHHLVKEFGGFGGGKSQVRARSSVNWPRARRRARGRCGSSRVAMTRCICGGRCSSRKARASWIGLGFDQVIVIEDEDDPVGEGGYLVDQRGQDGLGRWGLRGLEHAQCSASDGRLQSSICPGQRSGRPGIALGRCRFHPARARRCAGAHRDAPLPHAPLPCVPIR